MTIEGLKWLNTQLESLNIPYEYMMWKSDVPDTYFVGQYSETVSIEEGGEVDSDFTLIGTTKDSYLLLEEYKEVIEKGFPDYGLTEVLSNGWGIAVMFDSAFPIPAIEEGVYRINIVLKVKEWKGE